MGKIITTVLVGLSMALLTTIVLADPQKKEKQWSSEKTEQMEINRNTNAGVGNGGEWPNGSYDEHGEDCIIDYDPGNSKERNKAAKNDKLPNE